MHNRGLQNTWDRKPNRTGFRSLCLHHLIEHTCATGKIEWELSISSILLILFVRLLHLNISRPAKTAYSIHFLVDQIVKQSFCVGLLLFESILYSMCSCAMWNSGPRSCRIICSSLQTQLHWKSCRVVDYIPSLELCRMWYVCSSLICMHGVIMAILLVAPKECFVW